MCSIAVVFFGIVGIINAVNYYQLNKNGEEILSMISKNGGYFPDFGYHRRERTPGISPEAPFTTRYFTVVLDSRGTVLAVNTGKIAAISTKNASDYAAELFQKGKTKGYLKNYKYERIPYGTDNMYIFLDCEREIGTFYSFLWASLIVSLLGMLLVFLLPGPAVAEPLNGFTDHG